MSNAVDQACASAWLSGVDIDNSEHRALLEAIADGSVSADDAVAQLVTAYSQVGCSR